MKDVTTNGVDLAKHSILILVLGILSDRIITAAHFSYEANPLVSLMGIYVWLGISVLLVSGSLLVWYTSGMWRMKISHVLVLTVALFHFIIAGANLWAVYF